MNPNTVPDGQEPQQPTTPDIQATHDDLGDPTMPRMERMPYIPEQKQSTPVKVVKGVLGAVILAPLVLVGIIIVAIFMMSASHSSQRDKLEQETKRVFQSSGLGAEGFDCHDVELRNQCYFQLDATEVRVGTYLTQQGFSKDDTYGDGYIKGELYVTIDGDGHYTSYFVSKQ